MQESYMHIFMRFTYFFFKFRLDRLFTHRLQLFSFFVLDVRDRHFSSHTFLNVAVANMEYVLI